MKSEGKEKDLGNPTRREEKGGKKKRERNSAFYIQPWRGKKRKKKIKRATEKERKREKRIRKTPPWLRRSRKGRLGTSRLRREG